MEGESTQDCRRRSYRKYLKWMLLLVLLLLASPFCLTLVGFIQWSPINCWHYDVDINTGRIRYTRYLAYVCVRQPIEESALSRALLPTDFYGSQPNWQRMFTFSPRVHYSPNYFYGSAMTQIKELDLDWKAANFTPQARRSSAKRVLEIWHRGDGAGSARSYLSSLANLSMTNSSVDEKDLPIPQ